MSANYFTNIRHRSLEKYTNCFMNAREGVWKMKKKMLVFITAFVLICENITGCAAKNTVSENNVNNNITIPESSTNKPAASDESGVETENGEQTESQSTKENTIQNWDNIIYEETVLTRQAQADKVCIIVQPSILRKYSFYYYTPEDEEQKRLQELMEALPLEAKPYAGEWEGKKEKGWQIAYQDMCFRVFDGGYLEYSYVDEGGEFVEYFVEAPELCGYIQNMLQEQLNYAPYNPADIQDIVSAKLDVQGLLTDNKFYSQTITDEEVLDMLEDWFSNAEYIYGGADCGNQNACLEMELANGEIVRLSVATDSCSNFGINGLYYDYRPVSDWDNKDFFTLFDEIPWDWH